MIYGACLWVFNQPFFWCHRDRLWNSMGWCFTSGVSHMAGKIPMCKYFSQRTKPPLVGGLEHVLFFPFIGHNNPNWLSYSSEGLKPPTRPCMLFDDRRANKILATPIRMLAIATHKWNLQKWGFYHQKQRLYQRKCKCQQVKRGSCLATENLDGMKQQSMGVDP